MSSNRFRDGVGHIDDHLLERYEAYAQKLSENKRNLRIILTAVAACLAVVLAASLFFPIVPTVPTYDEAIYSAGDIAALFSAVNDGVSTNAYQTVFVPTADQLYLSGLPQDQYAAIYQYTTPKNDLDREKISSFSDSIIPDVSDALGIEVPEYRIEESSTSRKDYLKIRIDNSDYQINLYQTAAYHRFSLFSFAGSSRNGTVTLNEQIIQADQTCSDEKILRSLADIKQALFEMFGVRFQDAKVCRDYDSYSEYGVTSLTVYFYNESDHPLNAYSDAPVSDYIKVYFDNFPNYTDDIVSDTVLTVARVDYIQHRSDASIRYEQIANAKRISLKEAEILLNNGYVFGGHSCPLCMSAQEKVDFEDYDYVEFTYVTGCDMLGNQTQTIPFYAFYKRIGIAQNGNEIYAMTYVPAIEVSGLQEYFEAQKQNHK